jgi:hydrogenase maturation protein HypF
MSKEPRVSAVSLLRNNPDQLKMIEDLFSSAEKEYYLKLLQQQHQLLTSSMGRLLDGIAAMLKLQSINSYEGEAAMKLEAAAMSGKETSMDYYPVPINKNRLDWSVMLNEILSDIQEKEETAVIARKVFVSLTMLIKNVAARAGVSRIAFSGGVFQNALLTDLVILLLQEDYPLYFHRQLSPNDECIGFGQLAYQALMDQKKTILSKNSILLNH